MKKFIIAAALLLSASTFALASSPVVTDGTTSVNNHVACMDGTTGLKVKDCGMSPVTTAPSGTVLGVTTGVATVPGPVPMSGTINGNTQVLTNQSPTITDGFLTMRKSSVGGAITMAIDAIPSPFATLYYLIGSAYNSASVSTTYAAISFNESSATAGAETGYIQFLARTLGTLNLEGNVGNGVALGSASLHGPGSLDVSAGYWSQGSQGVDCGPTMGSTFAAATAKWKKGILIQCN